MNDCPFCAELAGSCRCHPTSFGVMDYAHVVYAESQVSLSVNDWLILRKVVAQFCAVAKNIEGVTHFSYIACEHYAA